MTVRYTGLALCSFLFTPALLAQLSFGGHPVGLDRSNALPEAPIAVMPAVDVEAFMAEDATRSLEGGKGPYRFGANHAVDLGLENSGVWHTLSNGDRVWRIGLHCPGAYSVNLEFHDYVIPEGAKVFVYNAMDDVLGAFEAGSNPGMQQMGVDLLAGDQVTVEYVEPARVAGQGSLRIGQVTHGYRDIMGVGKGLNESGECNNNVICPVGDNWRDQIRSVAMIVVQGSGICTGQLINNCANDGTPYFLTANHCLGGTNWIFRFNWNSPVCTPTTNGPTNQSIAGFTLLESSAGSDVALLRLNTTPPASYNVFYSGWDKSTTASTGVTAIHHPSGDIKKISFEQQAVVSGTYSGAQCWRVPAWDDGTTEQGSSGSGLWNQSGLLVGQLFGGQASCDFNQNDYYGKFSISAPLLTDWLGTCGPTLQGFPDNGIGMGEFNAKELLELVPNPTSGLLYVTMPPSNATATQLIVRDAVGRMVMQRNVAPGTTREMLDMSAFTAGTYAVEVLAQGVRYVQRSVLVR